MLRKYLFFFVTSRTFYNQLGTNKMTRLPALSLYRLGCIEVTSFARVLTSRRLSSAAILSLRYSFSAFRSFTVMSTYSNCSKKRSQKCINCLASDLEKNRKCAITRGDQYVRIFLWTQNRTSISTR